MQVFDALIIDGGPAGATTRAGGRAGGQVRTISLPTS